MVEFDDKIAKVLAEQQFKAVQRDQLGKALILSCDGKHTLFIETTPKWVKYSLVKMRSGDPEMMPLTRDNFIRILEGGAEEVKEDE